MDLEFVWFRRLGLCLDSSKGCKRKKSVIRIFVAVWQVCFFVIIVFLVMLRFSWFSRGKTTGGSSAVNAQMWVRGCPQDYDRWAEESGSVVVFGFLGLKCMIVCFRKQQVSKDGVGNRCFPFGKRWKVMMKVRTV